MEKFDWREFSKKLLFSISLLLVISMALQTAIETYDFYYGPPRDYYVAAANSDDFNRPWFISSSGYSCSTLEYALRRNSGYEYAFFSPGYYYAPEINKLISNAKNSSEAKLALKYWLYAIRENQYLLAGDAQIILGKSVDPDSLRNITRANQNAIDLTNEIWNEFSKAKSITPATAPNKGYELALFGDKLRISKSSYWAFFCDLSAIKVVLDDGRTIWILAQGGDIVVKDFIYGMPTYNPEDG